jgi:predicted Zn-dependent peptidase
MLEVFLDTAFTQHPYKRPVIGYEEDIVNLSRDDVKEFFATYYPANNLTIAIVGDVQPQEVKNLAKIYFGRFPSFASPPKVTKLEPPQTETREVNLELASEPWYLEGYHCGGVNDPDYLVAQIITGILSDGRTSRLYQSLVETQQVALAAEGFGGFPGDKYANLILFYALSAPGHSLAEVGKALETEIEKLTTELVSLEELEKVKTKAKANLLRTLDSNLGMAQLLVEYEAKTGDWQNLFRELDEISSLTPEDIQRVAKKIFTQENRTIGRLISQS